MTREETTEILKEVFRTERAYKYKKEEVNEALNMAIKALEKEPCEDCVSRKLILGDYDVYTNDKLVERIKALPPVTSHPQLNIKALGEDMRICQKSITDEKVLIGFNMAVALCNKHLAESEE